MYQALSRFKLPASWEGRTPMNKFTFCISAFLVALFISQHLSKPAQPKITVPVNYVQDANGGYAHAKDHDPRR